MFGLKMKAEKDEEFSHLDQIITKTKEASLLLTRVLDSNGGISSVYDYSLRIRMIDEACDVIVRQVAEQLKHSFGSLLDREDVYALVMGMSGVVDRVGKLAGRISRYQLKRCTPEMIRLADLIYQIVQELDYVVPAIDRPKWLHTRLKTIEVIQLESREVYRAAISELFHSGGPPTEKLMYKDIYKHLELILEQCADVVSLVERISIKHV